jgi:hypothetical protein
MFGLLWEYYATSRGLEIRVFRLLTVYVLRRARIMRVRLVRGFDGFGPLGWHPWNTLSMGNRWRRQRVLVEKRGWPRFLAITPRDPEAFVRELGVASS